MCVDITKFNQFYDFEVYEYGRLRIKKKDSTKWSYPNPNTKNIYLTYDQVPKNEKEAEDLVFYGKIDKTNYSELHKRLLGYDDKKILEITKLMDIRSINFIEKCYKNIGYLYEKSDIGSIDEKYFVKKVKRNLFKEASVYKVEDKYIIQFGEFLPPDDYEEVNMYFDKEPSDNIFNTLDLLSKIHDKLVDLYCRNNGKCTFKCYECGNTIHWLDVDYSLEGKTSLESKYFILKENYCGC